MAKCEEGYLCDVCGKDVESICESDLYLRFVMGHVDPEVLHIEKERHIRCNPALAQFIVSEQFESTIIEGPTDKRLLDAGFVAAKEKAVTEAWNHLQTLEQSELPIVEYPLKPFERRHV